MTKELEFVMEDGTKKSIKLTAHAATKIMYRNFFHNDIESDISNVMDGESLAKNADLSFADRLAFIMAKSAEGVKIASLTMDDFYEWLAQFSTYAFLNNFLEIYSVYSGQTIGTSESKK